jgi:hypothetical protein
VGGIGEPTVKVDTVALTRQADTLTSAGRELRAGCGGVDRQIPPLPDDDHGVILALIGLDEARERFDQRAGTELETMGSDLAQQAIRAADADHLPPLPVAAR